MPFCIKCGREISKGVDYCSKCGTPVVGYAKKEKQDYSEVGGSLVLVGGILSIIFSLFSLMGSIFWRGMMGELMGRQGMWGGWGFPMAITNWIVGFIFVGTLISILLGIISLYAYSRIKKGDIKNGGTIAIIVGGIMLVTMNWLAGIITLIGGILNYTSK